MLKRFSWKENDIYSIQLKKDLYIIAQLLTKPIIAFFDIKSKDGSFETPMDLNNHTPFGKALVIDTFIKLVSNGKIKGDLSPNLKIPIPDTFISPNWNLDGSYNLVKINWKTGDKGILGNPVIEYNIDKKNPEKYTKYEMTGYNMGYELVRQLILSIEFGKWVDPLKEERLLGKDKYPLKTHAEMWEVGVPKYEDLSVRDKIIKKKQNAKFNYLSQMYDDTFFPAFLVDKIKGEIINVTTFIENETYTINDVQLELDKMTIAINNLEEEFHKNNSEIETTARESISSTIKEILQFFKIEINTEEALRKRNW